MIKIPSAISYFICDKITKWSTSMLPVLDEFFGAKFVRSEVYSTFMHYIFGQRMYVSHCRKVEKLVCLVSGPNVDVGFLQ
jgi:hypothetical protein